MCLIRHALPGMGSVDNMELEKLQARMDEIAGQWNGDLPGRQEDNAHIALEVIEHIKEINLLLDSIV